MHAFSASVIRLRGTPMRKLLKARDFPGNEGFRGCVATHGHCYSAIVYVSFGGSNVREEQPSRFQLSMGALSPADRLEWFREVYGREMLQVDLMPFAKGGSLQIDMNMTMLPSVRIADGAVDPLRCDHLVHLADNDDLVFAIVHEGVGQWQRRGREASVTAGGGILTATGDAASFAAPHAMRMLNLRFNRQKIAERVSDAESALVRPVSEKNGALRLLRSYVGILNDDQFMASPEVSQTVDDHLHDLVALVLGPTREAADIGNVQGVRAARYRAIRDDIVTNLTRRNLSIDLLTGRHGVSERHIRGLFEEAGTTFTDFVRQQRLAKVHRMICDIRYVDKSISTIAFACGFGDLSYFNRAFRARYGTTPSTVRAGVWPQASRK
jgi:AraC-like DNA-binding protein